MRHATVILLAVAGIATLCSMFDGAAGQAVCVHCVCPPSYSPVCGYREKTKTLRGFPSRCVLECSNKCRKNKYEFVFNGRCGKYSPLTSSTTETMAEARPEAVDDRSIIEHPVTASEDNGSIIEDPVTVGDGSTMTYDDTDAQDSSSSSSTTSPAVAETSNTSPAGTETSSTIISGGTETSSTTSPAAAETSSTPSATHEEMQADQPQSGGSRGESRQQPRRSRPRTRFVASR